jgi:hypothetical protein
MKKTLLFSLVGGIILFVWQFISFAMPNLHESSMKYTPLQDEVLAALENSGLEEGMYMLGQPNPELPSDEAKQAMEKYEGKPWAILNYQSENTDKMAMNMIRGLIICFIIAYIFLWVIRQQKDPTVMKRVLAGLAIGLIGFFFTPYTNFIWFREPDIWAYFADGIVPWVILGWVGHKMA